MSESFRRTDSGVGNVSLRTRLVAICAACLIAHGLPAQARPIAMNPVGVWRGTSLCLVHPSPCHDETVVYRIARMNAVDSVSLDGRKIVNGQEEEMGVLRCQVGASGAQVTCTIPNGTFRFTVRGDSLVGDLKLSDGTKFRDVRTARSR